MFYRAEDHCAATQFDELVVAVRAVVDQREDWRLTARLVAEVLERHLPSPEILTTEQRAGDPEGYRSNVLHSEPDGTPSENCERSTQCLLCWRALIGAPRM